jgi:hypothetical protein
VRAADAERRALLGVYHALEPQQLGEVVAAADRAQRRVKLSQVERGINSIDSVARHGGDRLPRRPLHIARKPPLNVPAPPALEVERRGPLLDAASGRLARF